ncbi:hypothetical protein FACS1894166_05570 [Bacilli bacterium]|nr:hypothetical protein FACS1894166_05570 [Bacilli bacterium]
MYLGKAPLGINSLFFGFFERTLVPFGLHHAFYAPLWYTSAGGSIDLSHTIPAIKGVTSTTDPTWMSLLKDYDGPTNVAGDQSL